jgi:DNA-binding MarR family transcriptional regulator
MSHSSERQELGYLLKSAQQALRRKRDDGLRSLGLTVSQYAVLAELCNNPGQSNADLARKAFITAQSMQRVLANLEKSELIQRSNDENHGRRQPSLLTLKGSDMLARAEGIATEIEAKFANAIHPLTNIQVATLFQRIRQEFS